MPLFLEGEMRRRDECLLGAHTSTAGGLHHALEAGVAIGATTVQIFTSNQRQWKGRQLTPEILDAWSTTLAETGLREIMSHASYLMNLGASDQNNLDKSREALRLEIERCLALDISYLNFHPGSAGERSVEECLDKIVESLLEVAPLLKGEELTLLIENTAGQGSSVGHSFEQLGYLVKGVKHEVPIGICMDTCHAFAAGYDVRNQGAWNTTLAAFDQAVGLSYLRALHVNDSMKPFGSRRDRHASLGEGEIGLDGFQVVMRDPRLRHIPKYLETPEGLEVWKEEIKLLRKFAKDHEHAH